MNNRVLLLLAVGALAMLSTLAMAQSWDAQQTAAWQVVSKTSEMEQNQDSSWVSDMTTANVSGWSMRNPAPRGRDALVKWSKLQRESSKTLGYELAPMSIAIAGNAAVAHYYYSDLSEDKDGKRETTHG